MISHLHTYICTSTKTVRGNKPKEAKEKENEKKRKKKKNRIRTTAQCDLPFLVNNLQLFAYRQFGNNFRFNSTFMQFAYTVNIYAKTVNRCEYITKAMKSFAT